MTNASNVLQQAGAAGEVAPRQAVLTLEAMVYAAILVLALVLRLAELDTVPLTTPETHQALAAWRAVTPGAAGLPVTPESPLLFALHSLVFATMGASEITVRIGTALGGVLLVLSPALFRDLLGRGRALLASLVLLCSPTLLAASRFDSPVVWTVLLAVLALWAGWRWWDTHSEGYALAASIFLGAALLLGDPTGPVLVLVLLAAGGLALWLTAVDFEVDDSPGIMARLRSRLVGFPWQPAVLVTALVILIVSTQFFIRLDGLGAIGELLSAGLGGLSTARPGAPVFYPLLTSLFYEPIVWLFALIAIWSLSRRGALTVVERFTVGWLAFTIIGWLLYNGGGPEHALWAEVPLAVLVGGFLFDLLQTTLHPFWQVPPWAKGVLAFATVILLFIFTVHGQAVARSLLQLPLEGGTFDINVIATVNLVWVLMALLLGIIGVFLAAGIWGMTATMQGGALGVLAFALFTGIGSGWNIAVIRATDPVELWHMTGAVTAQSQSLRNTLLQLAERSAAGVNQELVVMALAPQDGVVAWALRDFNKTQFITDVAEAQEAGIVLLPDFSTSPGLGGDYVGDAYTIRTTWNGRPIVPGDLLAWWFQRNVRPGLAPVALERVVLWLRQDIYNGMPFDFQAG
jgi:4-amino-4-deoxy-L-arabinose transferase-like glycosyltransferase